MASCGRWTLISYSISAMAREMISFLFYCFSVILLPSLCFAQTNGKQVLRLHTVDGKTINFQLDEMPVTTFSEGMLNIRAGEFAASYPLESLEKYTFVSDFSGIGSVESQSTINIGFINNIISVTGLNYGERISVYGVDGTLVGSVSATDSVTVMDISDFQSGVYIVKAENARLKILKK